MSNLFSAKQPALGYYYQIIKGVDLLLSENSISNPVLSFEELDDISIERGGELGVFQTKFHANKATDTTDRSPDFWKTIRVWCENITNGTLDPNTTIFTLITTAATTEDSFIHLFHTHNEENEKDILTKMEVIASETTSSTNLKGYEAFQQLSEQQKKTLIQRIRIVDSNVSIDDTLLKIRRKLEVAAPSSDLDRFIESIVGWWFLASVNILLSPRLETISRESLMNQIHALRDQIRADALPDDFYTAVEVSDNELNDCESRTFVKQLSLINATKREKKSAISDYKRAYGQRSKWLRDGRVSQNEYDTFDSNLKDDWDSRFGIIQDDNEGKTEQEKQKAGHEFYRDFYVNPKHNMPSFKNKGSYITKGSYQMLSDNKSVGWCPDYKSLLENDETME